MLNLNEPTLRILNSDSACVIHLYDIEYDKNPPIEDELQGTIRWTNWDEEVEFNGLIYKPQSLQHDELSQGTDGQINSVNLSIANADREIQYYIEKYDLIGKSVILTDVYVGRDGSIVGDTHITLTIASAKTTDKVATFGLSLGFDFLKITLPRRKMFSQFCSNQFGDESCGLTVQSGDSCSKTFSECRRRFNSKNFGGFPAIMNERIYV